MISRRDVFKGMAAVPVAAAVATVLPEAVKAEESRVFRWGPHSFALNRSGQWVTWTSELESDLLKYHGIRARDIIENMHGTRFSISREYVGQTEDGSHKNKYTLQTNDTRDATASWSGYEGMWPTAPHNDPDPFKEYWMKLQGLTA